jgi:uncharacterized protein YdhG (YjbR/CyaY superfamily)
MPNPPSVDAYLADLPDDRRRVVEDIRRTVIAAAPDAVETVAYEMPALRTSDGHFLVSYAAFKNHYSLFPASDVVVRKLGREVDPYVAGKGTFRFPANRTVPLDLVRRIVETRVAELSTGH